MGIIRKLESSIAGLYKQPYNENKFKEVQGELNKLRVGCNTTIIVHYKIESGLMQFSVLCVPSAQKFNERELSQLFLIGLLPWMVCEFKRFVKLDMNQKVEDIEEWIRDTLSNERNIKELYFSI